MTTIMEKLSREVTDFRGSHEETPVKPDVSPGEIRDYLVSRFDFSLPRSLESIFDDVKEMMRKWNLHVTHPGYFGLFDPEVHLSSIIADALVALYNPQLASWNHAPAANEIERFTLNFIMEQFGFNPETGTAHFTSGGAEANLTAVITALTCKFPEYGEKGIRGEVKQPVLYISEEAHHSFNKIAHMTGLGRNAIRVIPVTDSLKMDLSVLQSRINYDAWNGFTPFLVVGTAGTTSSGTIDQLLELAKIASRHEMWFHVDAAWGGAGVMVPRLKNYFSGIENADSITCDAHKWLSVPMGAGMFFSKHKNAVYSAFRAAAAYMPDRIKETEDPYLTSIQWSRRFTGLKLFMSLSELGKPGMQEIIERQTLLGEKMKNLLEETGWEVVNSTPLPVVCFTHPEIESGRVGLDDILTLIYRDGEFWISETVIHGSKHVLRACITNYRSTETNIQRFVDSLNKIMKSIEESRAFLSRNQ